MSPVPEALLDGIAARPDDVAVWEVLTDWLLETDAPTATLARCELELLRGISNPDLLEALADARAARPRLPDEQLVATWRCGFVVRLSLPLNLPLMQSTAVLKAAPVRGLHHLRLEDRSAREGFRSLIEELGVFSFELAERLRGLLGAAPPHLRRVSLNVLEHFGPLLPNHVSELIDVLTEALPPRVTQVDLALGELASPSLEALGRLLSRVESLNLDGTRLSVKAADVSALLDAAPGHTLFVGGTGQSPRAWTDPRLQWLPPGTVGVLEDDAGVLVPLCSPPGASGYEALACPEVKTELSRDLEWSHEDGAVLLINRTRWRFRTR